MLQQEEASQTPKRVGNPPTDSQHASPTLLKCPDRNVPGRENKYHGKAVCPYKKLYGPI